MYMWQFLDALSIVPESKRQLAPTARLCSTFSVFNLLDAQRCPKEGCSSTHSRCELIQVDQNSIILINQQDAATRYCEICTQTVRLGFSSDKNFAQHEAGKSHQKKLTQREFHYIGTIYTGIYIWCLYLTYGIAYKEYLQLTYEVVQNVIKIHQIW